MAEKISLSQYKIWNVIFDAFGNVLEAKEDIHNIKGNFSDELKSTSYLTKCKISNGIAYIDFSEPGLNARNILKELIKNSITKN